MFACDSVSICCMQLASICLVLVISGSKGVGTTKDDEAICKLKRIMCVWKCLRVRWYGDKLKRVKDYNLQVNAHF